MTSRVLGVTVSMLLALVLFTGSPVAADQTIVCSSDDGRYRLCPVDTRGGVELERQISRGPCRYNDTWGYNRQGIWVREGCRAAFRVSDPRWHDSSSGWGYSGQDTIRCESDGGRRNYCRANTRGGVRLSHQLSRGSCDFGRSWGYDRNGIWVDHGCRADFELTQRSWGGSSSGSGSDTVTCESEGQRRGYCRTRTRGGVRLEKQLSRASCRFGDTWGYDSGGIWVRSGCRARFSVGGGHRYGSSNSSRYDYDDGDHDSSDVAKVAGAAVLAGAIAAIASQSKEKHDREVQDACTQEIERRISREEGSVGRVEFEEGDAVKEGKYREVSGYGRVESRHNSRRFRYECRVQTKGAVIVSSHYDF